MANIVKRLVDTSERLLYGATAEEAVARRIALIDRRLEAAFARMVDALEQDDDPQETTGNEREEMGA